MRPRGLLSVALLGRFPVAFVGVSFICHPVTSLAAVPSGDGSSPRRAIVCRNIEEVYARSEPFTKHIAEGSGVGFLPDRDEKRGLEIMAVQFTTPDRKEHKVYFAYPIDRADYLKKGWYSAEPADYSIRYKKNVERILERGFRRDVVFRVVNLPPFDPEWIIGVVRSAGGYRAFQLKASDFIWEVQEEEKEKLPTIRGVYEDKPISNEIALRLARVWREFLGDRKNYRQDRSIYGDMYTSDLLRGRRHCEYLGVRKRHNAREILEVSDDINEFVDGKKSLAALQEAISKAEKKVGLRK